METTSTRQAIIGKTYRDYLELSLTRHDANALLETLRIDTPLSDSTSKRLTKMLADGLKPWYTYQIKCEDCSRVYPLTTQKEIPESEIAKGGICVICSDDYK